MEKMHCPYCGSENVRELTPDEKNELVREYGQSSNFKCDDCDWLFDEDDIKWQELRHEISHHLIDTDEEHPIIFAPDSEVVIGEDWNDTVGLSTLEMLHCDRIFQIPGDGTIWIHIDGEYDADDPTGLRWHDIEEEDFLDQHDLEEILDALKMQA
jgi:hypothetical protein